MLKVIYSFSSNLARERHKFAIASYGGILMSTGRRPTVTEEAIGILGTIMVSSDSNR